MRRELVGIVVLFALAASGQSARLVLRWKDVPGAQGYELQIAKDPGFVEVVLQTRAPTAAYRWEQLPSQTHWWRVRSFDPEGRPSEWSQPRTVSLESVVPVPKSPADDALLPCAQNLELVFEASPLIKELIVELSASKDFVPARQLTGKGPVISLGVLTSGTWYWRAKATDVRGRTGESTGARRFTVRPAAPKVKPAADVVLGTPAVTLSWSEVACAASWVVEASTDSKERVSLPSTSTTLAFKPNAAGEYRWRVAAVDDKGASGEWSAESTFKVRLGTPVPRGESSLPTKLEVAWSPVAGASSYKVEIAGERDFTGLLASGIVTTTQFRASDLVPGRVFWRVLARDEKGHLSTPSEPRAVEIASGEPLEPVTFRVPDTDVVVAVGESLRLEWDTVRDASFYEVELDGAISPVAAPPRTVSDLSEGAHQLRLRAKGNGRASAWSEPREVFVGTPPVARAEVTVRRDELRVVLLDGKGRRVSNVVPVLTVREGSLSPWILVDGVYVSKWSPPASGEDVLRIEEREFVSEVSIERPLPPMASIAARLGGLFNFSSVASPSATLSMTVRLPVLGRRLGLEPRVGVYAASASIPFGAERVEARALVVPVSLLLGWHQPLGAFTLHGGVGPAFQVASISVDTVRETRVVGDLEVAIALGRELGPGSLELEVSGLFGSVDSQLARLSASGLGIKLGYSFALGGR